MSKRFFFLSKNNIILNIHISPYIFNIFNHFFYITIHIVSNWFFSKNKLILQIHISLHFRHLFLTLLNIICLLFRHCLLSTFRANFHSTFCPIRCFYIQHFVPFGVFTFNILSHSVFFHSTFCPVRRFFHSIFFPFDVLSHSAFCPVRH